MQHSEAEIVYEIKQFLQDNLLSILNVIVRKPSKVDLQNFVSFLQNCFNLLQIDVSQIPFEQNSTRIKNIMSNLQCNSQLFEKCDQILKLQNLIRNYSKQSENSDLKFVWRKSLLVSALEHGDWIVLQNIHHAKYFKNSVVS